MNRATAYWPVGLKYLESAELLTRTAQKAYWVTRILGEVAKKYTETRNHMVKWGY